MESSLNNTGAAAETRDAKTLKFGESMKNRMGIGVPEQNATDTYERGMDIVPECIRANDGEIPVKQYNIAILRNLLKFERAEGRLQLTNKRVIFRAAGRSLGGRTTLQHEFDINEIAGIEARRNHKFSFLYLIFAALIVFVSSFVIHDSFISGESSIFSGVMLPSHLREAFEAERAAVLRGSTAREQDGIAAKNKLSAEAAEKEAINKRVTAEQNEKRAPQGEYVGWYFRDYKQEKTNAQNAERKAAALRETAEKEAKQAAAQRELAETVERDAIKKRVSAEKTWMALMTVLGLILGIGGLIPFFALYKKFGVKLLILNISVLGFSLSYTASDGSIFYLFLMLTIIAIFVCMFLFCFRPNLVISIRNKGAKKTVDIRRDTLIGKQREEGTGFAEIIPTDETESAIREIGAIICDIKLSGDLAVKRWAGNAEPAKPSAPSVGAERGSAAPPDAAKPAENTAAAQKTSGLVASGGGGGVSPHVPPSPADSGGSGKKRAVIGIAAGIAALCIVAIAVIAVLLRPGHKDFYEKGKAYLDAENYAEAVNYLSKAIKARPAEAQYYYWRGAAHASKEIYGEAIADFAEAIRLDPENASYRFDRASAYYALKEYDEAIADYTRAIELDPSDARYYNSRGNAYRIKESYGKAVEDHAEAIRLNPDDPRYHNNLGVAYLLSKDYDNAAAAYTEAIRLAPDNARYRNNRGGAHNLRKDFDSAVEDFTEAARLEPDNVEYNKNLEKAVSDQSKNRRRGE